MSESCFRPTTTAGDAFVCGYSVIDGEPSPRDEVAVSISGPIMSVVLGAGLWFVSDAIGHDNGAPSLPHTGNGLMSGRLHRGLLLRLQVRIDARSAAVLRQELASVASTAELASRGTNGEAKLPGLAEDSSENKASTYRH